MKFIKYVFILAAIINIADVLYLFFKPKPTYEIASFDVNMPVYIIFKLFVSHFKIINLSEIWLLNSLTAQWYLWI